MQNSHIPLYLLPETKDSFGSQFLEYVRWFFWQVLLTLSAQESFFSSKRLERLFIFLNANIMLDICVYHLMQVDKLDWTGCAAIYSAQMVYAGFQTKQIFNEVKKAKDNADNSTSNTDVQSEETKNG